MWMRFDGRQLQHADLRLLSSDAPRDIDPMIGEGKTRAQIIAFYRQQYGEKVLFCADHRGLQPPRVDDAVLRARPRRRRDGARVGRWHSHQPSAPSDSNPATPPATFDPELRRKLEKELEERR